MTTISDERLERLTRPIIGVENRTAQEVFDIMCDRIKALRVQGGVSVKPLQWEQDKYGNAAESVFGTWWVRNPFSDGRVQLESPFGQSTHPDDATAKAAAQADYERRILSSLEASPAVAARRARNGSPCCKDIRESGRREGDEPCNQCLEALPTPVIHAVFKTKSGPFIGTKTAPIESVDQEDDGSFTVVIDHWPTSPAPLSEYAATRDDLFEAASDPTLSDAAVRKLCLAKIGPVTSEVSEWATAEIAAKGVPPETAPVSEEMTLDDEELDTILAIGRNEQSGRVTNYELKELVRVYRAALAATGRQ